MSKFKVGDVVRIFAKPAMDYGIGQDEIHKRMDANGTIIGASPSPDELTPQGTLKLAGDAGFVWPAHWFSKAPKTKAERAIAKAESALAALKERAAKKAQQAADRKARAAQSKALSRLTKAGKRVVAMLQSGSADDFGCQRENVILLAAAITGDKADDIRKALK